MEPIKRFIIDSKQPFIKDFNGQQCSYDPAKSATGASGQTKLYNLTAGGGLFLRDDEVKAA